MSDAATIHPLNSLSSPSEVRDSSPVRNGNDLCGSSLSLSLGQDEKKVNGNPELSYMKAAVQLVGNQVELLRSLRQVQDIVENARKRKHPQSNASSSNQQLLNHLHDALSQIDNNGLSMEPRQEDMEILREGPLKIYGWKGPSLVLDEFWGVLTKEDATLRLHKHRPTRQAMPSLVSPDGSATATVPSGASGGGAPAAVGMPTAMVVSPTNATATATTEAAFCSSIISTSPLPALPLSPTAGNPNEGSSSALHSFSQPQSLPVAIPISPVNTSETSSSAASAFPTSPSSASVASSQATRSVTSTTASGPSGPFSGLTARFEYFKQSKLALNLGNLLLGAEEEETVIEIKLDGCIVREMSTPQSLGPFSVELIDVTRNLGRAVEACSFEDKQQWIQQLSKCAHGHIFEYARRIHSSTSSVEYLTAVHSDTLYVPIALLRRVIGSADAIGNKRRFSGNLSVSQVMRDVERDTLLVNGKLVIGSQGYSKVLGSLALDILIKLQEIDRSYPSRGGGPGSPIVRASSSRAVNGPGTMLSPRGGVSANGAGGVSSVVGLEAEAFCFAERVLRGTTRTQSGGDIFDAISAVCKNPKCLIVPVSSEAEPVSIDVCVEEGKRLVVNTKSSLSFKVIVADGDEEWVRVKGTIHRTFTFRKPHAPGRVLVEAELPH